MPFTDSEGRVWNPRITGHTFVLTEQRTGKVMGEMVQSAQSGSISDSFQLAFAACKGEALDRKVSFESFAESIQTQAQMEALFDALNGAIESFFQNGGPRSEVASPAAPGRGKTSTP